jgi:hypothetical protein
VAHAKAHPVPVPSRPRRAYWQALLEEWRRSGLSQAEFCRRRGILPGTLAFWKHTLARDAETSGPRAPRPPATLPTFLPVRVVVRPPSTHDDHPGAAPPASEEIAIMLRGERQVRVRGRVDLPWLGQLVRMLETLGC